MHRPGTRLRRSAVAVTVLAACAAAATGPSAASAAAYRACSPASVQPLQRYAGGFATAEVKGVTCKTAVRLVRAGLKEAFDDATPGTPKVRGYRCRLSGSLDAMSGGDPFVQYTCSRGARRIRYMLVN